MANVNSDALVRALYRAYLLGFIDNSNGLQPALKLRKSAYYMAGYNDSKEQLELGTTFKSLLATRLKPGM